MSIFGNIKFEKASKKDIEEIYALEQRCFDNDAFSKRQFNYLVKKANGEFVVVRKNKKIIAYLIILKRKNSNHYRIYSIAIAPEARGLGIGKSLLKFAEEIALKNNTHKISLEVSENNRAAMKLYTGQGYQKVGVRPQYYSDGSPAIIMAKEF